jgi:hypothetical protein
MFQTVETKGVSRLYAKQGKRRMMLLCGASFEKLVAVQHKLKKGQEFSVGLLEEGDIHLFTVSIADICVFLDSDKEKAERFCNKLNERLKSFER